MALCITRSQVSDYVDNRDFHTRQFDKIVLKVPDVQLTKSVNTPIFKGSNLWNRFPKRTRNSSIGIKTTDMFTFNKWNCNTRLKTGHSCL